MNKLEKTLLFTILASMLLLPGAGSAQVLGKFKAWTHSLATTTTHQDSFFVKRWEQVVLYADSADIWFKVGAPDTASWSSRDSLLLIEGDKLLFGPALKLRRLEWWSRSGSGTLFFIGYKRGVQY